MPTKKSKTPILANERPLPSVPRYFRVILTKLEGGHRWKIVSNPRWDPFTRAQSEILNNAANDYAEYANCGCVYRMICVKNIRKYIDVRKFDPSWTLDPWPASPFES